MYPSTPNQSNCWDVQNAASLTHGQGGDAAGIISQVNYAVEKYSADKSKIYVMGFSSGGMMTELMAGSYPDVFEAAAAYSGVAFGCFQGTSVSILGSEAEREAVVVDTDPCEMDWEPSDTPSASVGVGSAVLLQRAAPATRFEPPKMATHD